MYCFSLWDCYAVLRADISDAAQSLLPTCHPNKQLGDMKFTAKYLNVFLEAYELSDNKGEEGSSGTDEDEDLSESNVSFNPASEAEEEAEEESEFYKGEYGDLYDDEAKKSGDAYE
ncbi:hypothetical protein CROQUDRAFT_94953 [Cronartium quercuum f. sp. fusiforme G11]|uniref:Uncharacterized protein n=1 Tax=Cronartium quercuum f. sp. fusiforme G11 TaxID=708437 RepID=A0A9P6NEI0_9BASI|nr:hypothetical protein CROQUDRAFT_94953 [Cronartium quercuum f. sp. fusiforme G11]